MAEDGSENRSFPISIRRKLENPPLLPGESVREFNNIFRELDCSQEDRGKTAADYMIAYEATVLIWNQQRLERMRVSIIRHFHPAAIAALLRRTSKNPDAEPGSIAYMDAVADAGAFFSSEETKKQMLERFAAAGFAPDAVEVEAFQLALQQVANVDRQIRAAQKQMLAFFRQLERRDAVRVEAFRKVARNAVSRVRDAGNANGARS
jgi:hypothetical protein